MYLFILSQTYLTFVQNQRLGIIYRGDETLKTTKKTIRTVDFLSMRRKYEVLEVLDFDSTRKRMSIILRELESKQIVLYCKGAEQFIIKKCVSGNFQQCLSDIQMFGEQGWRTLALSVKYLTEANYQAIKVLFYIYFFN